MLSISVHLHPAHLGKSGKPRPMLSQAPGSRTRRLEALTNEAAKFVQDFEGRELDTLPEVLRNEDCLVVRSDLSEDICLPILLSEVGHASSESISIIVFGRPSSRSAVEVQECSEDMQTFEVWMFVMAAGKAFLQTLQGFLQILSEGGAVRGDIETELQVPRAPFASGSTSSVYKVLHIVQAENGQQELRCPMAAKALPAEQPADVTRADQEVEMLYKAQGHPNIIRFRGFFFSVAEGEDPGDKPRLAGKALMLTEYCTRGSLWNRVKCDGTFAESEALSLCMGVFSALAHIHSRGIVHRDVKADNILRARDRRPILTDFGIACSVNDATAMEVRCGTPGYAAPEMLCPDVPYGTKVDVFGAGVTLYFLIFACTPFAGGEEPESRAMIQRTLECEIAFPEGRAASAQMRRLLTLLLLKDPADRPSAKSGLQTVELACHGAPGLAAAPSGQPAGPFSGMKKLPIGSVDVVVKDMLQNSRTPSKQDVPQHSRQVSPQASRNSSKQVTDWVREQEQLQKLRVLRGEVEETAVSSKKDAPPGSPDGSARGGGPAAAWPERSPPEALEQPLYTSEQSKKGGPSKLMGSARKFLWTSEQTQDSAKPKGTTGPARRISSFMFGSNHSSCSDTSDFGDNSPGARSTSAWGPVLESPQFSDSNTWGSVPGSPGPSQSSNNNTQQASPSTRSFSCRRNPKPSSSATSGHVIQKLCPSFLKRRNASTMVSVIP